VPRKEQAFGIAHKDNPQEAGTNNELHRGERDGKPRIGDAIQRIHAGDPKFPVVAKIGPVVKLVCKRYQL
jgi:hypothetical protein